MREALTANFVIPAIRAGSQFTAFRMSWFNNSREQLNVLYTEILGLREHMDSLVRTIPGVQYIVSALTATTSGKMKDRSSPRLIYPGVSYWMVCNDTIDPKVLYKTMADNEAGAKMKLLLQPFQQGEAQISSALYTTVKDNVSGGCVRKIINASAATMGLLTAPPVVKLCMVSMDENALLGPIEAMSAVRFNMELEK